MYLAIKVGILFVIASKVQGIDYSGSDDEYVYGRTRIVTETDAMKTLEPHRALIDEWYGSSEANEEIWELIVLDYDDLKCSLDHAWVLDDAKKFMLSKENDDIDKEDKRMIISTIDKAIEHEVNKSANRFESHCRELFEELRNSRSHLDCALGRHVVTEYFINMFPPTQCWEFTEQLWRDIVHLGDFSDRCLPVGVYNDLVRVAQIAKGRYRYSIWNSEEDATIMRLMVKLTATISSPEHLKYLNRIACPDQPDKRCDPVIQSVYSAVCGPISLADVITFENLIKQGSADSTSSVNDMLIVMDILGDVTEIVEELSKTASLVRNSEVYAVEALNSYLDIMDNTIGEEAKHVWTQLPSDESSKRLQFVLLNNEQYIGAMSNIIFQNPYLERNLTKLNREAMAVQLMKVNKDNNQDKVEFQFDDVEIETRIADYLNESDDIYKVYAIYYKSLAELMDSSGISFNNSTMDNEKSFLGKGGIVSLSARNDDGKKSLPVTYKMKFGAEVDVDGDSLTSITKHRCLSCEYLDTSTGTWQNTGCIVESVNEKGVTCKCNHTTNFAAFMSPIPIHIEMTEAQYKAKQIVSYVGSSVSVVALAASLLIFNFVRSTIKNDRLKAHINLAIALFFVHATQLTVDFAAANDLACLSTAILTHFFLLASFFWMLIEGIFLYLYVVQVFVHSSIEYIRWLFVLGWIFPAFIVAISCGIGIPSDSYLDLKETLCRESEVLYPPMPGSRYDQCWLSAKSGMAWSFIAPALIVIFINMIILGKVVQVLVRVSGKSRNIRPLQPPTAGSKMKTANASGFVNRSYGRKESEVQQTKYKTTSDEKNSKLKDAKSEPGTDYGSTTNGHSKHPETNNPRLGEQSPSRFDGRVPSQAYMYNKAHAAKSSPTKEESNGKNFVNEAKAAVKGALVLLPILGIPWICGLWVGNNYTLMMLFIVINSTQGLVIFIVYCLMNGEVRRAMQRHFRQAKIRNQSGRTRTSSTSSLRSLNSKFVSWRRKTSAPEPHHIHK